MDRRSWLWRRKSSSEKSPGETESTGSVSSERYSDEQEILKSTPAVSSPNHAQSPEVSSKYVSGEIVKNLSEKLSAALLSANAKEDLVKQHSKLTEEAVLGWEKAEKEVSSLKLQLEVVKRKNSSLEDRIANLDGALKECVRQLRQSREVQEQAVLDAVTKASHEWESEKTDLQLRLTELQAQLEFKTETTTSLDHELRSKLEVLEKENSALKVKITVITRDLQMRATEVELSTKAAETASKQHLESIKKVAKLEAECRRLHASARKSSLSSEHKIISNSSYVESCTDSQSDSGERLLCLDNEPTCSDSWASALMVELDQFRNGKSSERNHAKSVDIELIDDFLEMEKLASLPEADNGSSSFSHEADLNCCAIADSSCRSQLETMRQRMLELEAKVEKMTSEKVDVEMSLVTNQNQLKIIRDQLEVANNKVDDLQRQLTVVYGKKHDLEIELETTEIRRNEAEYKLESAQSEIGQLQTTIQSLHEKLMEEKSLSAEFAAKSHNTDIMEAKMEMELELEVAYREISKLQESMNSLEKKVENEKKLSAEFELRCQHMDSLEAKKKELETQLDLATTELRNMHEKVELSEWKIESMETKSTELEYQLNSANLKVFMLQEKVNILEARLEDERVLSTELAANLEAEEGKQRELVSQLEFTHKETRNLQNKLTLLGEQIIEERAFSAEFEAKYRSLESKFENAEEKRKDLNSELQLAHKEISSLENKLRLIEKQVEEEKALSSEYAVKYQTLESELLRKKKEADLQQSATVNYAVKIRQEKEFALSAEKLAECQKTIASLNRQLKSFATLDDFILPTEESKMDADPIEDGRKLGSAVTYGS